MVDDPLGWLILQTRQHCSLVHGSTGTNYGISSRGIINIPVIEEVAVDFDEAVTVRPRPETPCK
jgi:hypothetical protein